MSITAITNLQEVFSGLKKILNNYKNDLYVKTDTEDNFYLETNKFNEKGVREFFGAAQIKKNYVSFHLMPVYIYPELLKDISPQLQKKMQGKSCFNFKTVDNVLFDELKELTQRSFEKFQQEERL